jgi:hypothetical protein
VSAYSVLMDLYNMNYNICMYNIYSAEVMDGLFVWWLSDLYLFIWVCLSSFRYPGSGQPSIIQPTRMYTTPRLTKNQPEPHNTQAAHRAGLILLLNRSRCKHL